MKTNNRPMVKETITEHKYMNCETKEICWFDLSTGPKWFETTHYPVNDETRTREVERPMNDTELIEYLRKENNEFVKVFEKASKDNSTYEAIQLNRFKDRQEYFDNTRKLCKQIQELKGKIALQQSSYEKEFRELNDKLLKVVESVIQNQIEQAQNPTMMVMLNWMKEHLLQEIKSAMEKGKE